MRLKKLPLKLTTDNDFRSFGIIREEHCSDGTAGKHHLNVLGDNLLHEDSLALCSISVDRNGKSLENNHCAKIEEDFERHFSANYAPENFCNLKLVKSSHPFDQPYRCEECDYSTKQKNNLIIHIQAKHSLEKPFKCRECDYSACTPHNLKYHVQAKHTLEKPFKCKECDYSAIQEN